MYTYITLEHLEGDFGKHEFMKTMRWWNRWKAASPGLGPTRFGIFGTNRVATRFGTSQTGWLSKCVFLFSFYFTIATSLL